MLKVPVSIAILLALSSASAQTTAPDPAPDAAAQVVKIIGAKPTPTGESAKVFAAKRRVLKGTVAQKCALDSAYFTAEDDMETYIEQLEAGLASKQLTLQKYDGSAPYGDVSNVVDSSSLTGEPSSNEVGPCEIGDRKFAAGREHIVRKDKSFADALSAIDAKHYDKAAALLASAYGKIGYPEAAVLLAKLSLNGLGVPRSTEKALHWLDKVVGERFDPRRDKFSFDPQEPEAFNGKIEAALLLARLHMAGAEGVRKNPAEARKWYGKAADFGYVPALHTLGLACQAGIGGPKDINKARAYFQEAADEGYVPAQFSLAKLYYFGREGIAQNYQQAGAWFAEAAKSGHAASLYAVARIYDLGEGVPVNQPKAIAYYKEAALKSEPGAQSALASYFYTGEQVPKNLVTARKLFNEAAMQGQTDAMFNLAVMSANGEGGDQDLGMAYVWFSLAKASGHERAGVALGAIAQKMSPQDQARADAILKPRAKS